MFCGRHPRIIVQPAIPSLLGTYGNASQAFEWLSRAYAQRDGGLVDIKVDPLLRSLHADPRHAALLERCACHYEIHFTPPMKRNKPSGKLSPTSLRRISQRRCGFRLTCFQMNVTRPCYDPKQTGTASAWEEIGLLTDCLNE